MLERSDLVKQMNSMGLYARCAAVRERQIQEKAEVNERLKERQVAQNTFTRAYYHYYHYKPSI